MAKTDEKLKAPAIKPEKASDVEPLVAAHDLAIEGVKFSAGSVVGVRAKDGELLGANGVTVGHLKPRLRDKRVITQTEYQAKMAKPGAVKKEKADPGAGAGAESGKSEEGQ